MKVDVASRFGFLVGEVAKMYGDRFDVLARENIGLSRAQCRLLSVLAINREDRSLAQIELAQKMDLTPMAVATLCDRMEAAGWITRVSSATDRRVKHVSLAPKALDALQAAIKVGDTLTAKAQASMTAAEKAQLLALLRKAREGLLSIDAPSGQAGKQ